MPDLTPAAMEIFKRFHGNATAAQLRRAGIAGRARRRLVDNGILKIVHHSVYAITSHPETLESRCAALCLAHPNGYVTGPTSGRLEGLRRMPKSKSIHFCLPHGSRLPVEPGVIFRQCRSIEAIDIQRRSDGINVASPPRMLFDLGADLSEEAHASVVEQGLHEGRCTLGTLARVGRRLIHPSRPGSLRFATTLTNRVVGPAAESDPELRILNALNDRAIPVVAQHKLLRLPNGRKARIDIAVPELRWAIEIDIHPDHLLLEGTSNDKRRDRQCHLIGWEVERVTPLDLAEFEALIDELESLYHVRRKFVAALQLPLNELDPDFAEVLGDVRV
jgi:hypothetical protein